MDALQFAYWLQGFAELHGQPPTKAQWKVINDHLQLVFKKVTPPLYHTGGLVTPTPTLPGAGIRALQC